MLGVRVMPLVDLTPENLEQIADLMEENAYALPPGPRRTDKLLEAYQMRSAAIRAKWDDDFVINAEVIEGPPGEGQL